MKADAQYNDFIGTAAADVADNLGRYVGDNLKAIGKYFKINEDRFEIIGVSIYGTERFLISLLCVDKTRSTPEEDYIVSISVDVEHPEAILPILFKRLHIVLHNKREKKYLDKDYDEEGEFNDYHDNEDN